MPLSRRQWFSTLLRPFNPGKAEPNGAHSTSPDPEPSKVAVIKGRDCLAYRHLSCSTCHERCPEPGAIAVNKGVPTIVADQCTGCGICHDLCPAPGNAILMIPRKTSPTPAS